MFNITKNEEKLKEIKETNQQLENKNYQLKDSIMQFGKSSEIKQTNKYSCEILGGTNDTLKYEHLSLTSEKKSAQIWLSYIFERLYQVIKFKLGWYFE